MLKMLPHHETSFLVDWCMRIQYGETSCISVILHGHRVIMKLATFILYRMKSRSLFVESQMMSNSRRFVE